MSLFVTRLDADHERDRFDSGRPELDEWLRRHARTNDRRYSTARVWVLCDDDIAAGAVPIAYYTLSTHAVVHADVGQVGLPQLRQWPDPVPAVLLGRLAVAKSHQGRGLGTRLLRDAVEKVLAMQRHGAVVLFVVHAIDEQAADFYSARGFTRLTDVRLAARMKDLAANLSGH